VNAPVTIALGAPEYPGRLGDLEDPPERLHLRAPGDGARLAACLASPVVGIVGAREASRASCAFARLLATEIATAGVAVVSGLARGIDAAAHAGALAGGGRTVAVLGCGIDRDYPPATAGLAAEIARAGIVVSEYPPGTPPARFRFPARNRIVAAFADAVVVVSAAKRSGALITARLALDLGRDVLAVPGSPWEVGSAGANALLRDGALLVSEAADVLVALGIDPGERRTGDPTLSPTAARVLAALRREAMSPQLAAARCGLGSAETFAAVTELELVGLVVIERDGRIAPARAGAP
jgi:DNA processing protein